MSSGKLKAQYNRVRTSATLQSNSIWSKTIGLENEHAGANAAVEAHLRAPVHGGGGRNARRERAQQLIEASGYQPAVTEFSDLVALARAQGNVSTENRGACKICGGLGHLTKACKNFVNSGTNEQLLEPGAAAASLALLPAVDEGDLSSLSSLTDSSEDGSGSDSSGDEKRKKRSKSSKSKSSKSKSSKKRKHKKSSKEHKRKRSKKE